MMMMGYLLQVQGGVAWLAVLYHEALRSDSQALEGKADEQHNEQEEAAHPTSLPEGCNSCSG